MRNYETVRKSNAPVSENVLRIIKENGWTQVFIAEKAGLTVHKFYALVNNWQLIRAKDIAAIADALNVTPNELFGIKARDAPRRKKRTGAVSP